MKHIVTINLLIEGDVNAVLNKTQALCGDYSRISDDPEVEVTGIQIYKEHDVFMPTTAEPSPEPVDGPPQSLDEEQEDG